MNADPTTSDLRDRIIALRAEIIAAEGKIPRMVQAIQIRKQSLNRLEARLVLEDESRPARADHE